ncbi:hypothetical protein AB0F46_38875 [Streptomyces sp. NPDC026665]|uniref:hypothetical protein n=1 Tax=Streptomyces sp. NPDC026665 TaxID=3154798 RepID=UPI0033F9C556
MKNSSQDVASGDAPFWKQRSWQLAATFLGAALVISLISAVTDRPNDTDDTGVSVLSGPLANGSAPEVGERPGECRTNDADGAPPRTAPRDVKWRKLGGAQVPMSSSAGPTRKTGPLLWCFAHTPMGAVMAAHVIPAQMTTRNWRTVVAQQVVPGFSRDLFISQRASIPELDAESRATGEFSGFSLKQYADDTATVQLLVKSSEGLQAATSVSLRWSGGDWKVEPAVDGSLHWGMDFMQTAGGFVMWGR